MARNQKDWKPERFPSSKRSASDSPECGVHYIYIDNAVNKKGERCALLGNCPPSYALYILSPPHFAAFVTIGRMRDRNSSRVNEYGWRPISSQDCRKFVVSSP